jgi:hypothetical protein
LYRYDLILPWPVTIIVNFLLWYIIFNTPTTFT